MSIRTGGTETLRAAAVYAANDTYYALTNTIKCDNGADTLRLFIATTVGTAGNMTLKYEVSNDGGTTWYLLSEPAAFAAVQDSLIAVVPAAKFCTGDYVKISFKCSAGATSTKVAITGQTYNSTR
jgi:hypothetical protein